MSSAPILLASHLTFCENAHLVARHESPSSSVRFKRRQSVSRVEGDEAADAPDDRANTDLVPTEPATSGLGVVVHAPACTTLGSGSQPLTDSSWTKPRCRAQARQAQARPFRCASRLTALLIRAKQADHPTHAESDSLPQPRKSTEPANAAPVLLYLFCLSPRSLVRFCLAPNAQCLMPNAFFSKKHFQHSDRSHHAAHHAVEREERHVERGRRIVAAVGIRRE